MLVVVQVGLEIQGSITAPSRRLLSSKVRDGIWIRLNGNTQVGSLQVPQHHDSREYAESSLLD